MAPWNEDGLPKASHTVSGLRGGCHNSHDRIRDRDKQPTPEVGFGVVEQDDLPFTNCKPSRAATGSHGQCACGSETTQRVRAF